MQPHLSPEGVSTLLILGGAVVLLLTNRTRADVVALLMLASLGASKVLSPQEAFSGFSGPVVITIVSVLVMAQGLFATGAAARVADLLTRIGGSSERSLVALVMVSGAFLSLFMNNIAAASVLLPAVAGTAQRRGINASRLLMPLAFATTLGGMATLFTTVNIIMSGLLHERGLRGFGVLDFLPVGLPVVAAGILYMVLFGRTLLPQQSQAQRIAAAGAPKTADLAEVYKLSERIFRARIPRGSRLEDRTLQESGLRENYNLNVIAIESEAGTLLSPPPDTRLHSQDVLVVGGSLEEFRAKDVEPYLEILPARAFHASDLESADIVVAEIVLAPRSNLIGRTLREINLRSKYGFTVLAIWREGRPIRRGMAALQLRFGDALLIQGPRERLRVLYAERDMILLSGEQERPYVPRPRRMGIAIAIVAATVVAAAVGWLPAPEAMLGGGLLMVLTGCLSIDDAYATIEWKSVFLVAGMMAMALALVKSGVAALAADEVVRAAGSWGPMGLVAALFFLTALLVQALGGPASAAIVGPLAIQAAERFALDPRSVAMAVALASSTAFLTPLSHPVNVLVMAPGGYTFRDYVRAGLPLTLIVAAVVLALLPFAWPLAAR
jgi:di/tricarboxylate transporter